MTTENIYLDNAATTPLDPAVLEAMMPYMGSLFGNPSSVHRLGVQSRMAVEQSRKSVAKILGAKPSEIFFTSGGTESSNTAITLAVRDLGCRHIITSPIEHHAVLHTVQFLQKTGAVTMSYVSVNANGEVDMADLEQQLSRAKEKCLVTLMHANNEIGTMLDLQEVGTICKKYDAVFHSDTVQTVGHFAFDLSNTPVDFITGAAHKFHGPKGIGILYVRSQLKVEPLIHGGGQERNMRSGTENVYGIVGFAKALEIATKGYEKETAYISSLKQYLEQKLSEQLPEMLINGKSAASSLYTVLSISLPVSPKTSQLLQNLDAMNIYLSGGSACSGSGTSHVIQHLYNGREMVTLRFSFSKFNKIEELDKTLEALKSLS